LNLVEDDSTSDDDEVEDVGERFLMTRKKVVVLSPKSHPNTR
jgi:hypothetical protein